MQKKEVIVILQNPKTQKGNALLQERLAELKMKLMLYQFRESLKHKE